MLRVIASGQPLTRSAPEALDELFRGPCGSGGQREKKVAPCRRRIDPDPSPVGFHDAPDDHQPQPRAFVAAGRMGSAWNISKIRSRSWALRRRRCLAHSRPACARGSGHRRIVADLDAGIGSRGLYLIALSMRFSKTSRMPAANP